MKLEIDKYNIDFHFASPIFRYSIVKFLDIVKPVFNEYVERIKKDKDSKDPYPGIMTELMSSDERIEPFLKYISDISWDVLNQQGYDMDLFYTDTSEMWGQHHPYTSSMDKHAHGQGAYITGFYFLDTPEGSCDMFIYDPCQAKTILNLPIRQTEELTLAHSSVYYNPKPGDLIFTNSWLEHSFSRNASQLPYNFIHINVRVIPRQNIVNQSDLPIIV
jgi:hypothetical protein